MDEKINKIAKILGIIIGISLVLGMSYAVFRKSTTGEKENVVSAGKLDVKIENEQNEMNLTNALPQREKDGMKNTPYTFDIANRGNINAMYDLYVEIDNTSTLDASLVRYYLTVVEDGTEKQVTPESFLLGDEKENTKEGKKSYKIDTRYLDVNKANQYKLYFWLDYDATKEQAAGKTFKANIRVDSEQIYKENKLVKQVDVSENNDGSVMAYMYANGTVVIKGTGKVQAGLADSIKFQKDETKIVENYKKVLASKGYDTSSVHTMEDLETLIQQMMEENPNFSEEMNDQLTFIVGKDTLKQLGKDSDSVTDYASLIVYLQSIGYADEKGNMNEDTDFYKAFEENVEAGYSAEPISPSNIILEEGITNIPDGLYKYNEEITTVKIPKSVTSIGSSAFEGCTNLKAVDIPSGVTSIGYNAFYRCSNLKNITLPSNLTTLGSYAFYECKNLKTITIPSNVTTIGSDTFNGCSNLETVSLPSSLQKISSNAFSGCTCLQSVTIPDGVTTIGEYAFGGCKSLKSLSLPSKLTSIGSGAFGGCKSLETVTLPSSLTSLADGNVFTSCDNLKSIFVEEGNTNYTSIDGVLYNKRVTRLLAFPAGKEMVDIPESVKYIGKWAFYGCIKLTNVVLPSNITSLGESAFSSSSIESIEFSSNMTSLGPYSFQGCNNLENVIIPSTIKDMGYGAFYYCRGLKKVVIEGATSIGYDTFMNCTNLVEVSLPSTLTTLSNNVFYGCTSLLSITIPSSITSLSAEPFRGASNLSSIEVDAGNTTYKSIDGVVYTKDGTTLLRCPEGKKSVIIADGTTTIGVNSFYNTSLSSITIPNSVTVIKRQAFAFSTLPTITIPNTVTSVENSAFDNWKANQTINVDNTEAYINANWNSTWKEYNEATINYLRS